MLLDTIKHCSDVSEQQIIEGYQNMAMVLSQFNPFYGSVKSLELELDTNFLKYCPEFSSIANNKYMPSFNGEILQSLTMKNMDLTHINTFFKYQRPKPLIVQQKLSIINCRCDVEQNALYDPLKLTRNCIVQDILLFLNNILNSNCNELHLDINEFNLYLFDPQSVISTQIINNDKLFKKSLMDLEHFTFICSIPPKHNKMVFTPFCRQILQRKGKNLKSLTLKYVEYSRFHALFGGKENQLKSKTPFKNQQQYEFLSLFDVDEDSRSDFAFLFNEKRESEDLRSARYSFSNSHSYLNANKRYSMSLLSDKSGNSPNGGGHSDNDIMGIFDEDDYRIALQEYNKNIQLSNSEVLEDDFKDLQSTKLFSSKLENIELIMTGYLYKPLLTSICHTSKQVKISKNKNNTTSQIITSHIFTIIKICTYSFCVYTI